MTLVPSTSPLKAYSVVAAASATKSLQLCLTLCDPIDGSLPGSPVPGILQERTLCGLPFPSPTCESEVVQLCPTLSDPWTAAYQAPPPMGFSRQEYWIGLNNSDGISMFIVLSRLFHSMFYFPNKALLYTKSKDILLLEYLCYNFLIL